MNLIAIDPGPEKSAWVLYGDRIYSKDIQPNEWIANYLRAGMPNANKPASLPDILLIEKIECYGMSVGAEVFETVYWTGRFVEAWGGEFERIPRRDVKLHLCNSMRAKDANIRQAILDRFGGKGAVGTKKSPGPLYGISSHLWSALAIAITYAERGEYENTTSSANTRNAVRS